MQGGKEINNVSATTAIDLKAQLAQHVEQFEKVRSSTGKQAKATAASNTKKQTVWSRQNKGVQARNERDAKQQLEQVEGSTLTRSREQLERKARLYEAMKEGRVQHDYENEEQGPLIDFDRKYMLEKELKDNTTQKRKRKKGDDDEDDDDDPWVEYEDEFGRTRIVRRSELPSHNEASDHSYSDDDEYEQRRPGHDGFGSREDMNHYEADREIRTKGVGFYGFSKDEHERQQQLAKLKALRDETVDARQSATLSASEKRKQLLAKNAEKIRARKAALQAKKHHQLKPELVPSSRTDSLSNVNEDSVSEFLQSIRKQVEQ